MSGIPEMVDYSNLNSLLSDPKVVSLVQKQVELRQQVIVESLLSTLEPKMENSMLNVVKEQIDITLQKFNARAKWMPGDETHTSEPRHLELKFLDRVYLPVFSGQEIKAMPKGDISIRIELVDAEGNLVTSGLEASSDVEIMVIDDGPSSSVCGESGSCAKLNGKKRQSPDLSNKCLKLNEGRAVLDAIKLKHKAQWLRNRKIKLVARMAEKHLQTTVREAETEFFPVQDYRARYGKKDRTPLLSDKVCQLKLISRGGKLHKDLQRENINSVRDFLISHNMDPQDLQQRLAIDDEKYRVIVEHAKTCKIPGELYIHHSHCFCEIYVAAVFDTVGCVRGLVDVDKRFVPVDGLAEADKVAAQEMVKSAFQHKPYDTEAFTSYLPAQIQNNVSTSIYPRLGSPSGSMMVPNETDWRSLPFPEGNNFSEIDMSGFNCLVDVDRRFVPVDGLAEADKVAAQEMVKSAFQHMPYDTEASTSYFPAQIPNNVSTSIYPRLGSPSGSMMVPNETDWRSLPLPEGYDFSEIDMSGFNCLVDVDRRFVPVDGLAEADKVAAQEMVKSAFQHMPYDTEASTSYFPAQIPNNVSTSIYPRLGSPSGSMMVPNETDWLFFQSLKGGYDEFLSFKEPGYMRRLCVHSERKDFKNLRLSCPHLHSLLFFTQDEEDISWEGDISFIIPRYSRLRVLGIDDYRLNFWTGIPSKIGLFIQLKYLSVCGGNSDIPSSIGSLINLETFILLYVSRVSMPDTFWNLQKLRHVDMRGGFRLEFENLEKFPDLCELQSCSSAIIRNGDIIERLVGKFPNIRKLRCEWDEEDSNEIEILIPDSLWKLESIGLMSRGICKSPSPFKFDLPGKLRKLSLWGFRLNQRDVSMIGKLANLEVLKLSYVDFHENTWDIYSRRGILETQVFEIE